MRSEYQDYGYSSHEPASGNPERDLAKIYVSLLQRLQGITSVCDLGSGNGYLASELGRCSFRMTGIDASKSGVEIASTHYGTDKVKFICSEITPDLAQSYFHSEKFDAVLSHDVIEHLYRPSALIETAAALLKPGGYLIVGTPYHGYLKNVAISVLGKWDSHHGVNWDGGHIKFFSVRTLRELVERYGFAVNGFHYYGRITWLWKNMICVARKV